MSKNDGIVIRFPPGVHRALKHKADLAGLSVPKFVQAVMLNTEEARLIHELFTGQKNAAQIPYQSSVSIPNLIKKLEMIIS